MAEQLGIMRRTHYCGVLRNEDEGSEVILMGWVQKRRNLGGLIFVDLRDRTGITQIVFDSDYDLDAYEKAARIKGEYVLAVKGEVRRRYSINSNIPTGDIEVFVSDLKILSEANTLPIHIDDNDNAGEQNTLKYRYLDLRKPRLQKILAMRHQTVQIINQYLSSQGFLAIDTPLLYKVTPEGAREYIVPSRISKHSFYALPQSPQVFKQLLMIGGVDRYYQLAKCFRDEDLRADRQPEFTQLDIEMSFVDEEDIFALSEELYCKIFSQTIGYELPCPFPRITYDDAMNRFGSDKPDMRFGFELKDLSEIFTDSAFEPFKANSGAGRSVRAINIDGQADKFSRKDISKLEELSKIYGAKGLAYIKVESELAVNSSLKKVLSEEEFKQIIEKMEAQPGDLILIIADKNNATFNALAALRAECAQRLNLIDPNVYNITWVTEMPLYEYKEEEDKYYAAHHPFTMPKEESIDLLFSNREACRAKAYDLVINGYEVAGGSIRIHDPKLQKLFFDAVGLSDEEINDKFGFFLDAFKYGTPPHGGIAFGVERLLMLLAKTSNIKDVIAFPKNQDAKCLMTGAPSPTTESNLDELAINLAKKK